MTILVLILSLMRLLVFPVVAWAGEEGTASCDTELAFMRRYTNVVVSERERYHQRLTQMELERAYLKQEIARLSKAQAKDEKDPNP